MSADGEVNYVALDQIQFDKIITEWTGVTRWNKNWGWIMTNYRRLDEQLDAAGRRDRDTLQIPPVGSPSDAPISLPGDVMFWRKIGLQLT
ncbi:hypothetical protein FJT64_024588 [Amphibalanus amphitrite]|uniref:Uncharacterized protein n=1 Tax=Amphibalanus amphitrite TaxID=1232801 RepID=A0A6A4W6G0_AMPAM|nr:hypothetical protein FJT64_024588 [Amphibalanus amphitrite]